MDLDLRLALWALQIQREHRLNFSPSFITGCVLFPRYAQSRSCNLCRSRKWLTLSNAIEKFIIKMSVYLQYSRFIETSSIHSINWVSRDLYFRSLSWKRVKGCYMHSHVS